MRVVAISDTHNLHRNYGRSPFGSIPDGDVIIHAGDATTHGTLEELKVFLFWFYNLPHRLKILIAGNHDRCIEADSGRVSGRVINGLCYLENNGITFDGVKIWGSPFTPRHQDFAFQLDGDKMANDCWAKLPDDTDILITHGPPAGILDQGAHAGCHSLLARLDQINPRFHIFGHDHDAYGMVTRRDTTFINASVHSWLWKQTRPMHPVVFDIEPRL